MRKQLTIKQALFLATTIFFISASAQADEITAREVIENTLRKIGEIKDFKGKFSEGITKVEKGKVIEEKITKKGKSLLKERPGIVEFGPYICKKTPKWLYEWQDKNKNTILSVSDGKRKWSYYPHYNQVWISIPVMHPIDVKLSSFFRLDYCKKEKAELLGKRKLHGRDMYVVKCPVKKNLGPFIQVEIAEKVPFSKTQETDKREEREFWIDAETYLVCLVKTIRHFADSENYEEEWKRWDNIQINTDISDDTFIFSIPYGAKIRDVGYGKDIEKYGEGWVNIKGCIIDKDDTLIPKAKMKIVCRLDKYGDATKLKERLRYEGGEWENPGLIWQARAFVNLQSHFDFWVAKNMLPKRTILKFTANANGYRKRTRTISLRRSKSQHTLTFKLKKARKALDAKVASQLAAALANEECLRLYDEQPFLFSDYDTKFSSGRWHWGRLDPAGKDGLSAEVSFKKDGSDRKVKVYFSSDNVRPKVKVDVKKDVETRIRLLDTKKEKKE